VTIALAALALVAVPGLPALATSAASQAVCGWGGTPAAPTGSFHLTPGLTNTPATGPLHLTATGELAGNGPCHGTLTFDGVMKPGSTCAAQEFEGRVRGLPGVVRFWGRGVTGLVHEFLYDRNGNVVGADQPQAFTTTDVPQIPECNSTKGLTDLNFSAVVELFGDHGPGAERR
jgi:hypothetical protein